VKNYLWHENQLMRVVQNDSLRTKFGNLAVKIMGLVVYSVASARPISVPSGILIHSAVCPQ